MRKFFFLITAFTLVLSCSSDETSTPVTPPAPIVKYTITLSAGEGGTVSTTGGEYEAGQTVSVTATPQGEYVFTSWSDGNTNATRTITVSSNSTLTANFEKRKYPLTINFEGEGEVIEEIINAGRTTEYDSGTTVKLTAQAAAEWVFVGWTGDIESTEESVQILIGEPKEVTATFEKKKYTLTVNIEGEGEVIEEIIEAGRTTDYNSGSVIRLTANPSDEWVFTGWSGSVSSTDNPIELSVNESKSITATFETIKYTVSITAGEGGAVSTNGGEYEKGTNLTISATANTGFEFEKWSDDNTDNPRVILINSDIDLVANFVIETSNQLFTSNTTELDFSLGNLSVEDKVTGLNGAINGTISIIKGEFQHLLVGGTLFFRYPNVPYAHFRKRLSTTNWEFVGSHDIGSGVPRSIRILNSDNDLIISDFGQELSNEPWPGNYVWKAIISDEDVDFSKITEDKAKYHSLSIGDINGDGLNDLAAASWDVDLQNYDYNYSAWLNDGSSFNRITNFIEPSTGELQAGTAEIGDFDNDGENEILVARYGGNDQNGVTNFSVAAYQINSSTNNYEIIYNPGPINGFSNNDWGCSEMKIKDINNDGINDIIFFLEKSDGNALEIWKGNSSGEFDFDININLTGRIQTSGFLLEDIDYDGDLDLLFNYHGFYTGESEVFTDVQNNGGHGTINVDKLIWFNDGNGSFESKELGINFYEEDAMGYGFCRPFVFEDKINFIFLKGGGGPNNNTYIKEISINRHMLN